MVDIETLKDEIKGMSEKETFEYLYGGLPKKTMQFVDRVRLNKKTKYPDRMKFSECYISSIFLWNDSGIPSRLQYFRVEIAVAFNSGWKYIDVKMTVEELNEILKKQKNQKAQNFFAVFMNVPVSGRSVPIRSTGVPIRKLLKTYIHCKDFDIEVVQVINEEVPVESRKFYWTERLLEYYGLTMFN